MRFKQVVEEFENEKVSITVENSTEFKAGDIGKYLTGFEVLNPDLVICHLDSKASMQIDLSINKGRGYVQAEENRQYCLDVNVLPIDSIYTPIRNVKYAVEPFRVEQKTDYDKLVLEVTTDGSISPKDALKRPPKSSSIISCSSLMRRSRWRVLILNRIRSLMRRCFTCASCSRPVSLT